MTAASCRFLGQRWTVATDGTSAVVDQTEAIDVLLAEYDMTRVSCGAGLEGE